LFHLSRGRGGQTGIRIAIRPFGPPVPLAAQRALWIEVNEHNALFGYGGGNTKLAC
jgi:hypothetical protein